MDMGAGPGEENIFLEVRHCIILKNVHGFEAWRGKYISRSAVLRNSKIKRSGVRGLDRKIYF